MSGSSRLRVCAVVAVLGLAAALGWAPVAHAAGVSVPAASVPASSVVSTATTVTHSAVKAVPTVAVPKSPVVETAANAVAETLGTTVHTASALTHRVPHVVPATGAVEPRHTPRTPPGHFARRPAVHVSRRGTPVTRHVPTNPASIIAHRSVAAGAPAARPQAAVPVPQPPSNRLVGNGAAGIGSGFAPLFFALGAALLALIVRSRGRPVFPSHASGRACVLTLDLERPD